jgi:hypothetical protein
MIADQAIQDSVFYRVLYQYALKDFMLASFGIFCLCVVILVVASLVIREPFKQEAKPLIWEHWTDPVKVKCGSGLSDYRVLSGIVLVTFVALYCIFR